MSEHRLIPDLERFDNLSMRAGEVIPVPKRELLDFIGTVVSILGPGAKSYLTEIWLDELAYMDCPPVPTSPDWRRVSLAASARIASRLIEVQLRDPPV